MGSLVCKRKQIANQTSPQVNTRHSQSDSVNLPVANSPLIVAVNDFPARYTEPVLRMGEQLDLLSEWLYDGIDRAKAEELLLLPANQEGSFVIRKRQTKKGCYSLAIRCTNHESWNCVKHYRINCLENNWLYISPSLTFPSLHELVDYYSESSDGLCCCLKKPCFIQGASSSLFHNLPKPVEVKRSALNWQQIKSSDLLSEEPLTEDSPISLGLREAVTTYLYMTDELSLQGTPNRKGRQTKDI